MNWHCTNEHFTVDEFIVANCEYPGVWDGVVERVERVGDLMITVTLVYPKDKSASFYVTSFLGLKDGKIASFRQGRTAPYDHLFYTLKLRKHCY